MGCNAAGVIAARVIDSPRERLIAIVTNNFSLCNGRWPTQILIATIFIGAVVPVHLGSLMAAIAVCTVAGLGFFLAFVSSLLLSKTFLRGEVSSFSLELPPYRPPKILRTLYTSLIDRTIFVLWRAIVFAVPAGAVIWLISNVIIGEAGAGVMFETGDSVALRTILEAGGWTTLTAVCLMLFSLCHNPCSTTLYTIYKETKSLRWTVVSALMPLVYGFVICAVVAFVWRLVV